MSADEDHQGQEAVKQEGGDGNGEGSLDPSEISQCHKEPPTGGSRGVESSLQTPFLNPDPFQQWYGMENVAKVKINGESYMALLDKGAQVNTITLRYIKEHSLPVGLITDLMGSKVTCIGLGNAYTKLLGYIVIRVQVDGVQGYDEDQIALIIPYFSNHWMSCKCNERGGDGHLSNAVGKCMAAHLLAIRRMTPVKVGNNREEGYNTNQNGFVMHTQKVKTLEPFSSHVIPVKMMESYLGDHLNIMVQALYIQDGTLAAWPDHAEYIY